MSGAVKRKRISYTSERKLKIIEKAEEIGNREAGRIFSVDESNIRLWRKNKAKLQNMDRKRRAVRRGHASWPALENELHSWILNQRKSGLSVSTVRIRSQARIIATEMNIENFEGGATWCYRFMKRKKLCVRARTTVGQELPENWKEKAEDFLKYVKEKIEEKNFSLKEIINMDEVPLCFDCPPNYTVDSRGKDSISITTTGHEKSAFTVVLSCAADGTKLPPMIIFKRKTIPKEHFPKGIEVRAVEKGWMNEDLMISWINTIYRKRKGTFFNPAALLIMDSMRAHRVEKVKSACKSSKAELAIIPGGLTKVLQPLDVGVNKSFKSKVRNLWERWMEQGEHSYTNSGKMRRASYADICEWVKKAWDDVSEKTIKKAFIKAKIVDEIDCGSSSDYNSENDNDANFPEELIKLFELDTDSSDLD